jgi:hypothetical protein
MKYKCTLSFEKIIEAESDTEALEIATQDLIESLSDDTITLDITEEE